MANQNRHRAGSPVGGRYAPGVRAAADDCVQLVDIDEEQNQRLRGDVMRAAGALTGRGTIEASQQLAQMTDAGVAALRVNLIDTFNQAVSAANSRRQDSPRERLAAVMGPIMGGGTVGATERLGAMSDADVEKVLAELSQVWDEAAPSLTDEDDDEDIDYDTDPWGKAIEAEAYGAASKIPGLSPRERDDLAKGDAFIHNGQMFQRRRDYVYPAEPYAIAIRTAEPIGDDEMQQIAGLTGYAYSTTGGERAYGDPERVDERTFILHVDTTKSRAYERLDRFEEMLAGTRHHRRGVAGEEDRPVRPRHEGHPPRRRSRQGPRAGDLLRLRAPDMTAGAAAYFFLATSMIHSTTATMPTGTLGNRMRPATSRFAFPMPGIG